MGNPHSRRRLCFDRRADETGCGGASAQGYARRVRARCRNSLIRCITRLLTVTQEITRAWCRKVCTVLCASVCSSVRRTRVRCRKGSAHALPAWRRARSETDLRKAAREAARRAQVRESGYAAHYVEYKNISQSWREGFFITKKQYFV